MLLVKGLKGYLFKTVQLFFEWFTFLTACSSDLDRPSPNRGLPTEPRSQSTLSHRSIRSGHAYNEPKKHHHHRSKRSDATTHHQSKHHGNSDTSRRSADWVRSQQAGRRVQSAEPLTSIKGLDEAENVILIIREEFKRLGFLWISKSTSKSETAVWWFSVWTRW